ncbi:hypothetical protein U1Q18_032652 [Sarracenia purpurea var. burkii]
MYCYSFNQAFGSCSFVAYDAYSAAAMVFSGICFGPGAIRDGLWVLFLGFSSAAATVLWVLVCLALAVRKDDDGPETEKNFAETQERVLASKNDPAESRIEEEEGDESDGEGEVDSKNDETSDLESEDDDEEEGDESEAEVNQARDLCVAKSDDEAVGTTVDVTSADVCVVSLENLVYYGEDYHRGD